VNGPASACAACIGALQGPARSGRAAQCGFPIFTRRPVPRRRPVRARPQRRGNAQRAGLPPWLPARRR
jgi:hypothetical protein